MLTLRVKIPKLNIRNTPDPDPTFKNWVGDCLFGEIIHAIDKVPGVAFENKSQWYRYTNNRFYWEGGVDELVESGTEVIVGKETQAWFSTILKIPFIWDNFKVKGENVTVAVLDSGYDMGNNDLIPGVILKEKFISYATSIQDMSGHGTRCSTLVGCRNSFNYNIGVAPGCKLLIGKISNIGEMSDFESLIEGVRWAVNNHAEIISISYGKFSNETETLDQLYTEILQIINGKEVLIFACCGNNYETIPASGVLYPAALAGNQNILAKPPIDKIISVGATDGNNQLALLTLLNDYTTLHAPGVNIRSYQLGSIADFDSGTSLSTPIIAGIAALAVSYSKKKNNGHWNALDLKKKIFQTADPIANSGSRKVINAVKLFQAI